MRRLLNKKGSVLFLVLVVMSMLIIAASATYYVVNNQANSVNIRYSSEQSYQTALSVSNTVSKYIDGYLKAITESGNELSSYNGTIISKMLSLPEGGSQNITSDINLTDAGMGVADVTITKTKENPSGDNTVHTFEIITTANVNGETIKIVQVKEITSGPAEYFTRFFTSTGYRPEDAVIRSSYVLTDVYFENDFSTLLATMNGSIYASGALHDDGVYYVEGKVEEIVIGNNFIADSNAQSHTRAKYIYVGGSYIANATPKATEIYVLDDFILNGYGMDSSNPAQVYIDGDCYINRRSQGSTFCVNGNLYFDSSLNYWDSQGKFYVKKDVIIPKGTKNDWDGSYSQKINSEGIEYLGKVLYEDGTEVDEAVLTAWGFKKAVALSNEFSDQKVSDASAHISSAVSKNNYKTWDAEQYYMDSFYKNDGSDVIVPGVNNTEEIKSGRITCTITESCRLRTWANLGSYQDENGNWKWSYGEGDIIIDTGTKETGGKDIYIYMDANGSDNFSFGAPGTGGTSVIVKGDYSVIFILPENTNYVMDGQGFIGHFDLALQLRNASTYSDFSGGVYPGLATGDIVGSPGEATSILKKIAIDSTMDATIFEKSKFTNSSVNVHNNIFLVTKGKSNTVDFSNHGLFCGFVYAPHALLKTDPQKDEQRISVIGGMIVGSYSYVTTTRNLAFTSPYDYADVYGLTKRTDVVKYLIKVANGSSDSSDGGEATLQEWQNIGYK